ncbi:MAG TPA: peptide deformylase [Solirubrobacterales bacterium]|nr:peptide deformylase [Solirubrobacterales bacterium]
MDESTDRQRDAAPDPAIEAARRRRAYREIRLWGDPALRSPAAPVTEFDAALAVEVEHQARVLFDAAGAGLAAPQIGRLRRIVVYRLAEDPDEPFVRALVNPEILAASDEREQFEEGCLSMPGIFATVERAAAVTVHARGAAGNLLEIDAEGRHASVLQHEIDHLDGILVPDRLARLERKRYLAELRAAIPSALNAKTETGTSRA